VAHKIEEASGWIATVNITVTLVLLAPVVWKKQDRNNKHELSAVPQGGG
jgi:hypothetical protein